MTSRSQSRRATLSNWPVRVKVFAIVIVPLTLAGVLGGERIYAGVTAEEQNAETLRDAVVVGAAIALTLLVVVLVARSLVGPLHLLRDSALKGAREDLARELEQVRSTGKTSAVQPIPPYTTEEVGQVAEAVSELHEQAVSLAGQQARLQLQVTDMFETLSRRNRALIDQQQALIDELQREEPDPARRANLRRVDHMASRMRRNAANLLVLAGARIPREQDDPVSLTALVRAAAAEVEESERVVAGLPQTMVAGRVAGDLMHIVAELLDNALRYSPPRSQVRVAAVHTNNGGLVIEIGDTGSGMSESDLRVTNTRLRAGGEVNPYTARHMGFFVVGRLAALHGFVVRLRSTVAGKPEAGVTAGVYVPARWLVGYGPAGD